MEEFLGNKYKLKSSDPSFDDYLKYIEVGFVSRKLAQSISPTVMLTKNDDGSYTLTQSTSFRTVKNKFRLDDEFAEERPDGVKIKSTMTVEGNKLIQTQVESNGRTSKHVREITQDLITVTTTAEGWNGTCIRIYERIP